MNASSWSASRNWRCVVVVFVSLYVVVKCGMLFLMYGCCMKFAESMCTNLFVLHVVCFIVLVNCLVNTFAICLGAC